MKKIESWKKSLAPGRKWTVYCLAGYFLLSASDAHAGYLDPATGSLIIQMLVGAVLGAALTVKMWWYRLKEMFSRVLGNAPSTAESVSDDDA